MFGKPLLNGLAALSGLLIVALAPASASAAQDHFNCRASALRVGLPLGQTVEPLVANAPDNPCANDSQALVSFTNLLGISSGTLVARTRADKAPLYSHAKIEGLSLGNLLNLINLNAKVIRSRAEVKARKNGQCALHSSSVITGLTVQGQQYASLSTPMDVDIKLLGIVVAKLHLNATIGGTHPTIGDPDPTSVTQRAVWLHVTDPLLQQTLADVVVGETSSAAIGKPCS